MLVRLTLLFVLVPLIELAILVYLGTIIGTLYTVLIVVLTGLLGAILTRSQGLAILSRIRINVRRGILPANELFDGALILIGGLLLLTPGIITDILGLAVLVPHTRHIIQKLIRSLIYRRIQRGQIQYR